MGDYKELPCRRCGRVWKWAFDKKSVPYCPEGYGCAVAPQSRLEMKDLTLDARQGWKVIMDGINKAGSSSLRSAAEGKNDE